MGRRRVLKRTEKSCNSGGNPLPFQLQKPEGKQPEVSLLTIEGHIPKAGPLALNRLLSLIPTLLSTPSCKHVSHRKLLGVKERKEQFLEAHP